MRGPHESWRGGLILSLSVRCVARIVSKSFFSCLQIICNSSFGGWVEVEDTGLTDDQQLKWRAFTWNNWSIGNSEFYNSKRSLFSFFLPLVTSEHRVKWDFFLLVKREDREKGDWTHKSWVRRGKTECKTDHKPFSPFKKWINIIFTPTREIQPISSILGEKQ